jgi:hypothetical protein
MKKIPNWIIIVVVIALVDSLKIYISSHQKKMLPRQLKENLKVQSAVNYYVVKATALNNDVFATGKIGALNQIDILPEVGGKVTGYLF